MADAVAEQAAELAAQAGSELAYEELIKTRTGKLALLRGQIASLNSLYAKSASGNQGRRESLAEKAWEAVINNIEGVEKEDKYQHDNVIHAPKWTYVSKTLKDKVRSAYVELRNERNKIYALKDDKTNEDLIKEATKAMRLVLDLRAEILDQTNITETVTVVYVYRGKTIQVTIPFKQFLSDSQILQGLRVDKGSFGHTGISDPYALRMNATIGDRMRELATSENIKEFDRNLYDKNVGTFAVSIVGETNEYVKINIQKQQKSFVAEAIVRMSLLDQDKYQYRKDSEAWYQEPDVFDMQKGVSSSVKSFLGGKPTLAAVSTIFDAMEQLEHYLSMETIPEERIKQIIKAAVLTQSPDDNEKAAANKALTEAGFPAIF